MRTRKCKFEIIPLAKMAPLLAAEKTVTEKMHSGRILSVSYDKSLSRTREMLFSAAGYCVCSALATAAAVERCGSAAFDLIVIGHSIPMTERTVLLHEIRSRCTTPILALYRMGEPRLAGADHFFDAAESPVLLLDTVHNILSVSLRQRKHSALERDNLVFSD